MKTVVKLRNRRFAAKETTVEGGMRTSKIAIFNSRIKALRYLATGEGKPEVLGEVSTPNTGGV